MLENKKKVIWLRVILITSNIAQTSRKFPVLSIFHQITFAERHIDSTSYDRLRILDEY